MNKIRILAAGVAACSLTLLGAGAASASVAKPPPKPQIATLACQVTTPTCTEPVAAIAIPGSVSHIPMDDTALTFSGTSVFTDLNNNEGDGSQDWSFNLADIVPISGGGGYGFTGFDNFHYHGLGVYQIEATPFGQDSGLCLQDLGVLTGHRVGLRWCDGGKDQAWIVGNAPVPFLNTAPPPYNYALSVLQAVNAQHHNCLTAGIVGAVHDSRCVNKNPLSSNGQQWTAIP